MTAAKTYNIISTNKLLRTYRPAINGNIENESTEVVYINKSIAWNCSVFNSLVQNMKQIFTWSKSRRYKIGKITSNTASFFLTLHTILQIQQFLLTVNFSYINFCELVLCVVLRMLTPSCEFAKFCEFAISYPGR